MISMKKTLLSVVLLSTASAFSMNQFRSGAKRAADYVESEPLSGLVTSAVVALATSSQAKNLHSFVKTANDKVAQALKVDNNAIFATAAREALLQAVKHFGPDHENIKKVVHGLRYANFAYFVKGSGHLDVFVSKLPAALQNDFTRFAVGLAATRAFQLAGNKALDFAKKGAEKTENLTGDTQA